MKKSKRPCLILLLAAALPLCFAACGGSSAQIKFGDTGAQATLFTVELPGEPFNHATLRVTVQEMIDLLGQEDFLNSLIRLDAMRVSDLNEQLFPTSVNIVSYGFSRVSSDSYGRYRFRGANFYLTKSAWTRVGEGRATSLASALKLAGSEQDSAAVFAELADTVSFDPESGESRSLEFGLRFDALLNGEKRFEGGEPEEMIDHKIQAEVRLVLLYDEAAQNYTLALHPYQKTYVLQGFKAFPVGDAAKMETLRVEANKKTPIKEGDLRIPVEVWASSHLSERENSYPAENLLNDDGPWVEGVRGNGVGQSIRIAFEQLQKTEPEDPGIGALVIVNGYHDPDRPELFKANSRVRTIRITCAPDQRNEFSFNYTLKDTTEPQRIPIPPHTRRRAAYGHHFQIRIRSVYPGSSYQDTCISKITGETAPTYETRQ